MCSEQAPTDQRNARDVEGHHDRVLELACDLVRVRVRVRVRVKVRVRVS